MRMKRYITFDELIFWATSTPAFEFNGVQVDPSTQWHTISDTLLPFLNGSKDNPYSTTNPKEKLPAFFTTATSIGTYLNEEYGDRLVATEYRGGSYYPRLRRNLNHNEAMELILAEMLSKTINFISIYGFEFIRLFGTVGLDYDPRFSSKEIIKHLFDYGEHIVDNDYGARLRTDNLGNTFQTNVIGNTAGGETLGQHTDNHSETQMNDVANPKLKTRDDWGAQTNTHHEDTHTDTIATNAVINTSGDAAAKDTMTSKHHRDSHTIEKDATGLKTIQETIEAERKLNGWNPALEFFKAFTDKILLRAYYY